MDHNVMIGDLRVHPYFLVLAGFIALLFALGSVSDQLSYLLERWIVARQERLSQKQREEFRLKYLAAMQTLVATASGVLEAQGLKGFLSWLEEHLDDKRS